jgi:polysaccharide export outer membrane protein
MQNLQRKVKCINFRKSKTNIPKLKPPILSLSTFLTNSFLLFVFSVLLISCVKQENLVRLQNSEFSNLEVQIEEYRFRNYDQVQFEVRGVEPNSTYFYNIKSEHESDPYNEASLAINSLVVNNKGELNFPKIGIVKAAGFTVSELEMQLADSLSKYFKVVFVKLKVVNQRFVVGGEVKQPGLKSMPRDFCTLTEALAMAGDVTDYADLSKVRVLRRENGIINTHLIDLRNVESMRDPYFIIRPNDEIYVQPNRMKALDSNLSPVRTLLLFLTTSFAIIRLF